MRELGKQTLGNIGGDPSNQPVQMQIEIDDEDVPVSYASLARVTGTAEEITVDFGGPLKQTGNNRATLRVEQRIVLNPWAAKRLALTLGQTVSRYEQAYGTLELDERKRREAGQQSEEGGDSGENA